MKPAAAYATGRRKRAPTSREPDAPVPGGFPPVAVAEARGPLQRREASNHLRRSRDWKTARWRSHLGSRAIFRRTGSVIGIFSALVRNSRYS